MQHYGSGRWSGVAAHKRIDNTGKGCNHVVAAMGSFIRSCCWSFD